MTDMRRGVFPGSFNPPTRGHLAIVHAAIATHDLDRLDLVMSRRPLVKGHVERPTFEQRLSVLRESVGHLTGVHVIETEQQLIADIADGYDVVVMGADKWAQINDPRFYESLDHLADSLARLPKLAIVARGADPVPAESRLEVAVNITNVSSTSARSGEVNLMTPQARASGLW